MDFLTPLWHTVFLITHIIGFVIGVGTVTVTDYFHLIGLRSKKLEKKLIVVYPIFSKLIFWAILIIFFSGAILLINKTSLLDTNLFILKMVLFEVILVNGLILQKHVFPHVIKCVLHETGHCPIHVLWISSISGAISFTTWYATLILSLTKDFQYSVLSFLAFYFVALIIVFLISYLYEVKARIWEKKVNFKK